MTSRIFVVAAVLAGAAACSHVRYRQTRAAAELVEIKDQALGGAMAGGDERPAGGGGGGATDRTKCLLDVRDALAGRAKDLKLKAPHSKLGADTLMFALLFEQSYIQVDLHLPAGADGRLVVQSWAIAGATDERNVSVSEIFASVAEQVEKCP